MMKPLVLLFVYIVWGFPPDCAGQRYAIVAPRVVRPYSSYPVMVANIAATRQRFRCKIVNANNGTVNSPPLWVGPKQLGQVDIDINSLAEGKYRLQVWDDIRQQIINSTELEYSSKSFNVLFQTDKPVYKPGDNVQFRVLFLLPDAKPVRPNVEPNIFITDPRKYRMKQWINATLQNGVFEGSFQLASYTAFGSWKISALVDEQYYAESFSVEEYIRPLFKVELTSIPHSYFHCQHPHMDLLLSATYIGGGRVTGNATVVVRANYNNYPSQTKEVAHLKLPFRGSTKVRFPTAIVAKSCDEVRNVWFDVTVEERLTGVSYNLTNLMYTVHNTLYNMEVLGASEMFYPGSPMQLKVRLSSFVGTPLNHSNVQIKYRVQRENEEMDTVVQQLQNSWTNPMGIINVVIDTTDDTVAINVEGVYQNYSFPLVFAQPAFEDSTVEYLTAYANQAYYGSKNISINLFSNTAIDRIFYIGYCGLQVCSSGVLNAAGPSKNHTLVIQTRPTMAPHMELLAFAVKEDGKILSTAIDIRFLPYNPFDVKRSEHRTASKLNLTIISEEGAFVGLLGVDHAITLRPSINNDITLRKLETAMKSLEDFPALWYAYDSFLSTGVTLLTDGYLEDVGIVPHVAGFERAGENVEGDSFSQHFPETWIWDSLTTTDGKNTIEYSYPDTVTTWMVTAFSVGPKYGLQILQQPIVVEKSKKVYSQLHVPFAIKRFEEVTGQCVVHNMGKLINVIVEVKPNLGTHTMVLGEGETKNITLKLNAMSVGVLTIQVIVRTMTRQMLDAIQQSVEVHPEGTVKVVEDVRLVHFHRYNQSSFHLMFGQLQPGQVGYSGDTTLSVIGTLLNLNPFDLERMVAASHGNGAENLMVFRTTMAVYEYQNRLKELGEGRKNKYISYMEIAYQQQLRFRLNDGSFSFFGSRHKCGSIWFTATTVEALLQMSTHVPVDDKVISEALEWISAKFINDRAFNESCTIVHPHIQRTGGKELSLASSVMFAFVKNKFSERYTSLINDTLTLLTRQPIENVYVLAKTAYLLTLVRHPEARSMLKKLNKLSIRNGPYVYWNVNENQNTPLEKIQNQEATAYALLANLNEEQLDDSKLLAVAQWIQKNCFNTEPYIPSLQKIIALRALKALGDRMPAVAPNITVGVERQTIHVNETNSELLQTVYLPKGTRNVTVSVNGRGLVLIKFSYRYTVPPIAGRSNNNLQKGKNGSVTVHTKRAASSKDQPAWHICTIYYGNSFSSVLLKTEVILPTGFQWVQQEDTSDNRTISVISLEEGTKLQLFYIAEGRKSFCFFFQTFSYFSSVLPMMSMGLIRSSPFDMQDYSSVYRLN